MKSRIAGFILVLLLLVVGSAVVASPDVPEAICNANVPFDGALTLKDEFYPVVANICSSEPVEVDGEPAGYAGDLDLYNFQQEVANWQNPHVIQAGNVSYSVDTYRLVTGEEFVDGPLRFAPGTDPINLAHYVTQETATMLRVNVAVAGYGFDSEGYTHGWKWSERAWVSMENYPWAEWERPLLFSYVIDINPADDTCLETARFDGSVLMLEDEGNMMGICSSVAPFVNGIETQYSEQERYNYIAEVPEGTVNVVAGTVEYTAHRSQLSAGEQMTAYAGMSLTAEEFPVNVLTFAYDGWNYIQATGFGYLSSGYTHMHDFTTGNLVEGVAWDTSGLGQNYLATQTVEPEPTPTPGPTETPEPPPVEESFSVNLPIFVTPRDECWDNFNYPSLPFIVPLYGYSIPGSTVDGGIGICSPQEVMLNGHGTDFVANIDFNYYAEPQEGVHTVAAGAEAFEVEVAYLEPGEAFVGEFLTVGANSVDVNIVEMGAKYGYDAVYSIRGYDYSLIPKEWSYTLDIWNFDTGEWNGSYAELTVIGVK